MLCKTPDLKAPPFLAASSTTGRSRSPSLSTFGTKKTYKGLMRDEFFSERSQKIPPQFSQEQSENQYKELSSVVEYALGNIMKNLGTMQTTISQLPLPEFKTPLREQVNQIISFILPLLDSLQKTKQQESENLSPNPSRSSRNQKSIRVSSPLSGARALSGEDNSLAGNRSAKTSPNISHSAEKKREAPESPTMKPLPPSRENRPALKDVSVFSNDVASVDVSLGHFKKTKRGLRPFLFTLDEKRRHTAAETRIENRGHPRRLIKRWNSGPNLNSWEMPKLDSRSNFTPPEFKRESTKDKVDVQALFKRQESIQHSLQLDKLQNIRSPLTFALTEDNHSLLVGGEITAVFEWILERSTDWMEVESILFLHRLFCKSESLIKVLFAWYETVSSRSPSIKLRRAAEIIEKWITLYPQDFTENKNMQQITLEFIECGKLIDYRVCQTLLRILNEAKEPTLVPILQPVVSSNVLRGKSTDILNVPALEIAKYFANSQFAQFQNIFWQDLITAKAREQSKAVDSLIKNFTCISLWIATEIIRTAHAKKRGSVIRHFIQVAQFSLELRSFATVSAIVAGLNMTAIQRLKKSWKTIPKGTMDKLNKLEGYVMPYNNFAVYRKAIRDAPLPCLPFLGIYCRDLTHVEEGNPDFLENGHVNLEKMRIKTAILKEIRSYQNIPYNFTVPQNTVDFISQGIALSLPDRDIKKLSFQIEPRNDA